MPFGDIVVLVLVLLSVGWWLWRRFARGAERREVIDAVDCMGRGIRGGVLRRRALAAPPTIEPLRASTGEVSSIASDLVDPIMVHGWWIRSARNRQSR